MATVPNVTTPRKPAKAYYGILDDAHGIFAQRQGVVSFRDDATETWYEVDLPTLTRWAVLLGEVAVADMQALMDGERVKHCSQT